MSKSEHSESNGGHKYASADAELSGYFTSAVGLKGQGYEVSGGNAFSSNDAAERMLKQMRWLSASASPMSFVDRVAATLQQLAPEHRITLSLVYAPHAWPATWMASALATPWGSGSMAALVLTLPKAVQGLRRWLLEVDRPLEQERKHRETACARLVRDGEMLRLAALKEYETLRVLRVAGEIAEARRLRAAKAERSAQLLAEELGMDRRIARARAERSKAAQVGRGLAEAAAISQRGKVAA
jgi:hypothetical protein